MVDLLHAVEESVAPHVTAARLTIVDRQVATSFDNELVTLASGDVRVSVVRERGVTRIEFASVVKPSAWFGSGEVMELLGVSKDGSLVGDQVQDVLAGLVRFLNAFWNEIQALFDRTRFANTEAELLRIRKLRDDQRWG